MADDRFFPTASELRQRKQKSLNIQAEVMAVQNGILTSDAAGAIEATISNTPFTMPESPEAEFRYQVFKGQQEDRLVDLEFVEVEKYFKIRGYSITKVTNPDTGNTFMWSIKW